MKKIAILIIILSSCDSFKIDYPYHSSSINESKKKKVFLNEYICLNNKVLIRGDTIMIKEVWAENSWYYKNIFKQIQKEKVIYLEIVTDIDCRKLDCVKNNIFDSKKDDIKSILSTVGSTIYYHAQIENLKDTFKIEFINNQEVYFIKKN